MENDLDWCPYCEVLVDEPCDDDWCPVDLEREDDDLAELDGASLIVVEP